MSSYFKRPVSSFFPGFSTNAVLQLILANGVIFVAYNLLWAVMRLLGYSDVDFFNDVTSSLALAPLHEMHYKLWTLLTYAWLGRDFWTLLSSMLWLYCFGSLVQMLIGYRQIFPLFIYSLLAGGVVFVFCQFIPGSAFIARFYYMGPSVGIFALAIAGITLSPSYRFYLGDRFAIPLWVVLCIYTVLMLVNTGPSLPVILLLAGGGAVGHLYIRLLREGYKPGEWIYNVFSRIEATVTPNPDAIRARRNKGKARSGTSAKSGLSQTHIDDILDKINQKGYNSLSQEEKNALLQASKKK